MPFLSPRLGHSVEGCRAGRPRAHMTRPHATVQPNPDALWTRRYHQVFVTVGTLLIVGVVLWAASHVARALLLIVLAALLAYALAPAVRLAERFLPRPLALLLVYLVLLGGVGGVLYLVITTAIVQFTALATILSHELAAGSNGTPSLLVQQLERLGVSPAQIAAAQQQLTSQAEGIAQNIVPAVSSLLNNVLDAVLVTVMSVYLLIDGQRISTWLTTRPPKASRERIATFLTILQHVVGGYIRGQLLLSTLIGVLVGVGMLVLHVPAAIFLGVLAFVMSFIPIIGTLISGGICVLLALTQGWVIAVIVLAYFIIVHVLEGDVVGPRIVGKAVGLHPVISIAALIAGGELFGIIGALLASPLAGLVQAILADFWIDWRTAHPEQFIADNPLELGADAAVATAPPLTDGPLADGKPDASTTARRP